MFLDRFLAANWREDTSSEELLASGVTTKATKKEGMPLAVEKFWTASTCNIWEGQTKRLKQVRGQEIAALQVA